MRHMPQHCDATAVIHSATVMTMPALTRLRTLRLEAAYSQEDLAKRSGVSRTTIIRLEGGDPNVLPSTLGKLAKALKVKPTELWRES
jgi:DNA-binding XRE family transcriptional regulator